MEKVGVFLCEVLRRKRNYGGQWKIQRSSQPSNSQRSEIIHGLFLGQRHVVYLFSKKTLFAGFSFLILEAICRSPYGNGRKRKVMRFPFRVNP